MFFLRSYNVFINLGLISPIFRQILKYSMVTKWYQLESICQNIPMSQKWQKDCFLRSVYAFINFELTLPIFSKTLKCSILTKWQQLESMSGHANGSETAKKKKKNLILRSDYAVINFGIIPPTFGQILKCSLMTKWYQLESMSGHANKSGTAKNRNLRHFHLHLPVNSTNKYSSGIWHPKKCIFFLNPTKVMIQ